MNQIKARRWRAPSWTICGNLVGSIGCSIKSLPFQSQDAVQARVNQICALLEGAEVPARI